MPKKYGAEEDGAERKALLKSWVWLAGIVLLGSLPAVLLASLGANSGLVGGTAGVGVISLILYSVRRESKSRYDNLVHLRVGEVTGLFNHGDFETAKRGFEAALGLIKELKAGDTLSFPNGGSPWKASAFIYISGFCKYNVAYAVEVADRLLDALLRWIPSGVSIAVNKPAADFDLRILSIAPFIEVPTELIKYFAKDVGVAAGEGTVVKKSTQVWKELIEQLKKRPGSSKVVEYALGQIGTAEERLRAKNFAKE